MREEMKELQYSRAAAGAPRRKSHNQNVFATSLDGDQSCEHSIRMIENAAPTVPLDGYKYADDSASRRDRLGRQKAMHDRDSPCDSSCIFFVSLSLLSLDPIRGTVASTTGAGAASAAAGVWPEQANREVKDSVAAEHSASRE